MGKCFFCNGEGFWEDCVGKRTLFCPICNPIKAEYQSLALSVAPTSWAPSAWDGIPAKYIGPRFQVTPWLLVIHSGAYGDKIAEYFENPGDGRRVSAHLAWSGNKNDFIQCVPFSHVAWHCGGSAFGDHKRLNFKSISIELPGPWDKERDTVEMNKVRTTVTDLLNIVPTLTTVVRHSDINPKRNDPGPGFKWEWLEGLGLDLPFA